jgi:dihydrolipoamide dehydrogenase
VVSTAFIRDFLIGEADIASFSCYSKPPASAGGAFTSVDGTLLAAPGCYAVGDVNGLTLLAHAAEHQGEWVARHILGRETGAYASGLVPSCIFGHTEVMRIGKTAKEIKKKAERLLFPQLP